jgi:hypothetical protein
MPISKGSIPKLTFKFRVFSIMLHLLLLDYASSSSLSYSQDKLFLLLCTAQANRSLILLLAIIGEVFYV